MNSPMRVDRQTGQGVIADVAVTHSMDANESVERIIGHHAATCFARRNWQSSRGIILRVCAYVDALYIPVFASSVAGRKKSTACHSIYPFSLRGSFISGSEVPIQRETAHHQLKLDMIRKDSWHIGRDPGLESSRSVD